MILLDTNAAIAMMNDPASPIGDRAVQRLEAGETVALSAIVTFELWWGVAKSRRRAFNEARYLALIGGSLVVLPFDADDAASAAEIRAALAAAGTPIGPFDVLIAGQALRHGATLVTTNTREFERVPGLKVEDWTAARKREAGGPATPARE